MIRDDWWIASQIHTHYQKNLVFLPIRPFTFRNPPAAKPFSQRKSHYEVVVLNLVNHFSMGDMINASPESLISSTLHSLRNRVFRHRVQINSITVSQMKDNEIRLTTDERTNRLDLMKPQI